MLCLFGFRGLAECFSPNVEKLSELIDFGFKSHGAPRFALIECSLSIEFHETWFWWFDFGWDSMRPTTKMGEFHSYRGFKILPLQVTGGNVNGKRDNARVRMSALSDSGVCAPLPFPFSAGLIDYIRTRKFL